MSEVHDNRARSRYELETGGGLAIAAYTRAGDILTFTHTEVPPELAGQGLATRLIAGALADVRRHGGKIVPQCPFVAAYVERHPDVRALVAD